MAQHIEMIIDYAVVGDGAIFRYSGNHGVLVRCKDCIHFHDNDCPLSGWGRGEMDYCSKVERRAELSRIKGRYVATLEIDFDAEREPGMVSIEEMQESLRSNKFTENIHQIIQDEFDFGEVQVTQQYADVYEVEEVEQ